MINTPQATSEKKQRSRFFSSVVLTGTTLLFLLQPGFSKNSEKVKLAIKETLESYDSKDYTLQENQTINTSYNFQQAQNTTQGSNDALSFASNKVNLYYPDMKDHLATMIKSFRDQEHQDATIVLLNKMAANITDPKQKTGAIIGALEYSVFYKSIFGDKYGEKISDETFKYIEIFDSEYKTRFKGYYTRLEANLETLKNNLEEKEGKLTKGCQEMETIMNKFSPSDIKGSPSTRKLVTETQALFISSEYRYSQHTKTLFDAL